MATSQVIDATTDPTIRNANAASAVEVIDEGATLSWLHDGKIACFTITSVARATVDAWLNRSNEIAQAWPADKPYLAIQDVTAATLTPYIRERSAATVAMTPKYLKGRSAVVISPSAVNRLIQMFVTVSLARQQAQIQRKVFLKKSEAIAWLLAFK
jgi:hypothetical protein